MSRPLLVPILLLAAAYGASAGEDPVPNREAVKEELCAAAEEGDFENLKNLLTKYPDMKDVNRNGFTLLHRAFGSREMVEYLIDIGADMEAKSGALWTPLHSQAYSGHQDGVEVLLDHGADIEAKTSFGHTPLLSSLRWDRIEVTRLLLERGANVDPTTEIGRTPLIVSAIEGNGDVVELLLEHDADVSLKDHIYERTALHFAALYGQLDITEALVRSGADVNDEDAAGRTPLDYAIRYGHEKVARLLKSAGAAGELDPMRFGFSPYLKEPMKNGEAFAWYMGHSGYAVKTKNNFLLFNYSHASGAGAPAEPRLVNGRINLDEIADCRVIVFASSAHHSHHHPEVFRSWQEAHENITFVYSFEDKLGRNPRYFKDVEGPEFIYMPDGEKKNIQGVKVETVPVISPYGPRCSGFLVEVDGLVIFCGGKHVLVRESERKDFRRPIDTLKNRGTEIDLLILPGNYGLGRITPLNLEGIDYAVKTLEPEVLLVSGGDATEFVLREVAATLEKYGAHTRIFCPEQRGDVFVAKR